MNKVIYYFLSAFLFSSFISLDIMAQGIRGSVIDSNSRQAIPGASARLENVGSSVTTDELGRFYLDTKGSAAVQLHISASGYHSKAMLVSVGDTIAVSLDQEAKQLGEVVIKAYESEKRLFETAGTVGQITASDIDRFDKSSPLQVMNTMPGVKIESTTIGRYTLKIRGGSQGIVGHNDNYKTYWNGIPLTRANGRNPLGDFDLGAISRMNIIRGPAGSMYGAGIGGVILVENQTPRNDQTSLVVEGMVGSYGLSRLNTSFSLGGSKGDIRLQYTNLATDGYRDEAASDNSMIKVLARLFPSEKQTVSLLAFYTDRSYGIPGALNAEQVKENPRQASFSIDLDNGLNFKNTTVGLSHEYRWNNKWKNTSSISYQSQESDFLIGNDFFVAADRTHQFNLALRTATAYKFNLFDRYSQLIFGGEYNKTTSNTSFYNDGFQSAIFSSNDALTMQALAFGQLEISLPYNFIVTLAGSFNYYKFDNEELIDRENSIPFIRNIDQFSPRIAVVKPINEHMVLHGNISHGFSPPQNDAYYNTDGSTNLSIGATQGFNKEIGFRGSWLNRRLTLDMTAYTLNLKDVIVPKVFGNMDGIDLITNENAGAIDQHGLEIATGFTLTDAAEKQVSFSKLWASLTYNDYKFEEYNTLVVDEDGAAVENDFSGKQVPGIHPYTFVAGFDANLKVGFYLNTTYSFYDRVFLNNANTDQDESYQLLDAKVGYKTKIGSNLQAGLYAGANNILDASYTSNRTFNAFLGAYFDPSPGRNYYTGLNLTYLF